MNTPDSPLLKISIIIPTINESANLLRLINSLKLGFKTIKNPSLSPKISQHSPSPRLNHIEVEYIVVDFESTDNTENIAKELGCTFIKSPRKGRGFQMNLGAQHANGDILMFIHADSYFDSDHNIGNWLLENITSDFSAGYFTFTFPRQESFLINKFIKFLLYIMMSEKSTFFRFGDQGLCLTRSVFEAIGGYDENLMLFEGQDIARRIIKQSSLTRIPILIHSSDRRYIENGRTKTLFTDVVLIFLYRIGFHPNTLVRLYKKYIKNVR